MTYLSLFSPCLVHAIYSNNPTKLSGVMRKYKVLKDSDETVVWGERVKETTGKNCMREENQHVSVQKNPQMYC